MTSWLDNLVLLAGAPLASTPASIATENNTFYAKSLTTPSDQPMSQEAIAALASWMSAEGWYTETVRNLLVLFSIIYVLVEGWMGRTGSSS